MKFTEDGREDHLKGGSIKLSAKKEEIAVATVPARVEIREAPAVQSLRTNVRTIAVPNLVQPPLSEISVPAITPYIPAITKRSNGMGAHYDSHDVRYHMINSLGRHPRLLHAYLRSSVI